MFSKRMLWVALVSTVIVCFAGLGIHGMGRDGPGLLRWVLGLLGGEERSVPEPVPYLAALPSAVDGQGRVEVTPPGPFLAGSQADFEISLTVGEAGVSPGGFVMLQVSPWWGWSPPQTFDPSRPGYTTVHSSFADPPEIVRTLPLNRILLSPGARGFRPGEIVTFRYGGGARVDRFAEEEERFQVFVDADGDGHSAVVEDAPLLRILAGEASQLQVNVPSQAQPGEPVSVRVVPLDPLGNWSRLPAGRCSVRITCDGRFLEWLEQEISGGEDTVTFSFTPRGKGVYFFRAEGPGSVSGQSNVLLCEQGVPRLKRYFGDLHGHSRLSDGTGTPEAFYRYAREVSGLDIAALTDHSDYGTIPVRGKVWERILAAADRANDPGRFVTFAGFEWTSWEYGHRNVYYRDGARPVFRAMDPESDTPEELWKLLEPYEFMTVAHHVGGGPVATDWDVIPGHREWLVEICSMHGSSETYLGEAGIYRPVKGHFVQDALSRGYRLGIIGSGDTHDGHPGQRSAGAVTGGLLGVYSKERTREAVWEAFRKRRVYATTGPKILLHFRVADAPMGSETAWAAPRGKIPLAVRAVGCDRLTEVEILRNGEAVFRWDGEQDQILFFPEDPVPPAGTYWYYARVRQRDGNMAWSSPVWVRVE